MTEEKEEMLFDIIRRESARPTKQWRECRAFTKRQLKEHMDIYKSSYSDQCKIIKGKYMFFPGGPGEFSLTIVDHLPEWGEDSSSRAGWPILSAVRNFLACIGGAVTIWFFYAFFS